MVEQNYEYYKTLFKDKRMPFAFVDLDLLDKNIRMILGKAADRNIRIASKSIRCRAVMEYVLKKQDQFKGVMSFYGEEAVWLSQSGFDDILMGYPIVDVAQIKAIGEEVKKGKYICLMVDHKVHLDLINQVGTELGVEMPVCIDLDMSIDYGPIHFGVYRSPITDQASLKELLVILKEKKQLRLDGLMGYEAQIAGLGDAHKGKGILNKAVAILQKQSIPKIAKRRKEAIDLTKEMGFALKFVNGGGTGSIETTVAENGVTEVTVGSGFFNAHLFDNYSHFQFHPAAAFAVQATRIPKRGMLTCHGGGYIASGEIDLVKAPIPYLPEGLKMEKNEGAGEVQTPIYTLDKSSLQIGDPIFFRHSKSGELCERFNELYFVRDAKIERVVPTFRGDGKCFI